LQKLFFCMHKKLHLSATLEKVLNLELSTHMKTFAVNNPFHDKP
jgi:hypothetical protein